MEKESPSSGSAGASHYFEKKKAPYLTWWWEYGSAFASIFSLPLLALVPCNTSVEDEE
jgi:hypothetical protein